MSVAHAQQRDASFPPSLAVDGGSAHYRLEFRVRWHPAWLVLIATFAAHSVYYTMLRMFPVAKVSAAIYLSPPVTMFWTWMLFSEPLTLGDVRGPGRNARGGSGVTSRG